MKCGLRVGRVLLAAIIVSACSNRPPEDTKSYVTQIAVARASKDTAFANGSDSPVPANRRGEMLPLAYFPIDPDYAVPAVLRRTGETTTLQMPTSTGGERQMRRVG